MNPETGEGFDAVQVGEETYFDPNALEPSLYPGALGLEMRKKTWWQGDVEFETFETIGPKFGPKWPEGTMKVSGLGMDVDVWGLTAKSPPPPGYDPWLMAGLPGGTKEAGGTNAGTNILTSFPRGNTGPAQLVPKHEWTPCFEDDGGPTLGDFEQRNFIDIVLLGAYGGDIKFPVMPEEFGADFTHEYWTPRVVGLGEIVMPGGQSMETISWDSFFPATYDSDYCVITPTELEDPRSVTARLIWTMRFKMDCMLLVGGGIWNDRVVITNFNYRHRAGEIFDIYYTITMKRYRAPIVSTSPNPDSLWDRWYKDPRHPGAPPGSAISPGTGNLDQDFPSGSLPSPADANPDQVVIDLTPVPPGAPDVGLATPPGVRDALITIETATVQGQPAKDIRQPGGPSAAFSETFQQVVFRLAKEGPNDMAGLLGLNQWVSDNNYNPYTSMLPIGSGVRYYKETPVSAAKPTTMTTSIANPEIPSGSRITGPGGRGTLDLNRRADPATIIGQEGGVPQQTPQDRQQGGIRR